MRRKLVILTATIFSAAFLAGRAYAAEELQTTALADMLETEKHIAYISGDAQGNFRPQDGVTRGEAAQMFYNLLLTLPEAGGTFEDVPEDSWYADAVGALSTLGVVEGREDGSFAPGDTVTRAEFITMAAKFVPLKEYEISFTDVDENHWAYPYISSACGYGWTGGYDDGSFQPGKVITRAEAVTVINTLLGREADPGLEKFSLAGTFQDVKQDHWAYANVMEASQTHDYIQNSDGTERWNVPENDYYKWEHSGDGWKFFNATKESYVSGFRHIGGMVYYFDPETNILQTGWQEIDGKHYLLPEKGEAAEESVTVGEHLTLVNYTQDNRKWQDIEYITMHYTALPGDTAYGWCETFYSDYAGVSAHYFVDESSIWQSVSNTDIAWHSGSNVYHHATARNENSIGIEMCCRKVDTTNISSPFDEDWYFLSGTEVNAAELVKTLMKQYGVPIENVIRHNDISHKVCPAPYVTNFSEWQRFLSIVTEGAIEYDGAYEIKILEDQVSVYAGPGKTYSVVGTMQKDDIATVLEEKVVTNTAEGRWVRIGLNQWVSYSSVERQ